MRNNFLKKIFLILSLIIFSLFIFSCEKKINNKSDEYQETEIVNEDVYDFDRNYGKKKTVVAYFSATGNTKAVAEKIAEVFECDMMEIVPEVPYTETDFTSYDPSTRPMREKEYNPFIPVEYGEDEEIPEGTVTELPKIKKMGLKGYNIVFLGYPIWFNDAPRVIYSFISTENLENTTIIPFCTSGSDKISPSDQNIADFAPENVNFMSGARFSKDTTLEEIKEWAINLGPDLP